MKRRGLTLLELLVVLTILISISTIIVPVIGGLGSKSQQISTRENLERLQDLLVNQYKADMGELPRPAASSARQKKPQLRYLFVNPDTEDITVSPGTTLLSGRVWRGPYVMHRGSRLPSTSDAWYGVVPSDDRSMFGIGDVVDSDGNITTYGDPTVVDAWNHPIVIQEPTGDTTYARLLSAGPNGKIDTDPDVLMPDNTATATGRSDDILFFLYRADQFGDNNKHLSLSP